jgi:hypothetical protein
VRYLETYAAAFDIRPDFGARVTSISRAADRWHVSTASADYSARHVVLATGYTRVPNRPTWPGLESFRGSILHSAEYSDGAVFRGRNVLVVGFGNSGGEIAIDLIEHGARPIVSVRHPVNVLPRELFGLPILAVAIAATRLPVGIADALTAPILRFKYGNLTRLGLRKLPYGPLTQIKRDHQVPLIDIGTIDLIRDGRIVIRRGIRRFDERSVRFEGGDCEDIDAVVMATGYRPELGEFLRGCDELLDERGGPARSGAQVLPGLHCCGFFVSPTGMLREIAGEALGIAASISAGD